MFWKKRRIRIEKYGEFTWDLDNWYGEYAYLGSDISIGLDGTKESPATISIAQLDIIFESIDIIKKDALTFLAQQDISEFTKDGGALYFSAIYSTDKKGVYDIEFSLTDWEEAYIIVHFQNKNPYNLSLGD